MKVRRLTLVCALFAAPLAAQAAAPPHPAHEADLRCLAGMAALASNDEDEVRQAGIYGTIYFMGKLLGHDRSFDLVARLGGLDYAVVTPELQGACLAEVQSVADRMLTFGTSGAR